MPTQEENGTDVPEEGDHGKEKTGEEPALPAEELQKEYDELNDRFLRLAADFENYRRQVAKERESVVLAAESELIREIIPIAEDVGRAIAATTNGVQKDGLILVQRNFDAVLARHGVVKIESVGRKFDSALHEALCSEASEAGEGMILEEYESGYTLRNLLLRPAKVKIATKLVESR